MARGIGENPARSPAAHLQAVDYPATRDELVQTAADNDAPVEVINFLKSLPKQRYASYEEALRDFAEAERRFGVGKHADDGPSREDIGKKAAEAPAAPTPRPRSVYLGCGRPRGGSPILPAGGWYSGAGSSSSARMSVPKGAPAGVASGNRVAT